MFVGSGDQGSGSRQCKESHFYILSFASALSGDHDVWVMLSWWGSLDAFVSKLWLCTYYTAQTWAVPDAKCRLGRMSAVKSKCNDDTEEGKKKDSLNF